MIARKKLVFVALVAGILWSSSSAIAAGGRAEPDPCPCVADLEATLRHIEDNYAGYPDAQRRLGPALEAAVATAREGAAAAKDAECDKVIREYLANFSDGHLMMHSQHSPAMNFEPPMFMEDRSPVGRALDDDAFLLRIPSFMLSHKPVIEALLEQHAAAIGRRALLVLDLRGNTGGSDSSFSALLPLLYTRPIELYGLRWRATRDNAEAIEAQLDMIPESAASMREAMQGIADTLRAGSGELVQAGPPASTLTLEGPMPRPERIGIIVDGSCASSTEQFLLAAQQSDKVTIFGARTYGAVDFLNIRIAALPSGRQLQFAMSVSRRIPGRRVDLKGIVPQVMIDRDTLRDPDAAVEAVRQALADAAP